MRVGLELFARQGIDKVSVAALNKAAEASNNSAIHYHFGGIDGLIEAILEEWENRAARTYVELSADLAEAGNASLRDEVRCLVAAYAQLLSTPDGIAFLCLVGQLLGHPRFEILERHRKLGENAPGILSAMRESEARAPALWLSNRMLVTGLLFHGLADYARLQLGKRRSRRKLSRDAFENDLVDAITAVLSRANSREG